MRESPSLFWAESDKALLHALDRASRPSAPPLAAAWTLKGGTEVARAPGRTRFVPAFGSLEDRLASWLEWIGEVVPSTQVFLLDKDGLPMLQRGADNRLLELGSYAHGFLGRLGGAGSGLGPVDLALRMDGEHVLHVMEMSTVLGTLIVGFVRRVRANMGLRPGLAEALTRCFDADGAGR